MTVHVARLGLISVSATGVPFQKNAIGVTQGMVANSSTELRVLPDASYPNTTGYPTIKAYLTLEAISSFKLQHLDQSYIITYA